MKVEIEVEYFTDSDLKPCVKVPLTNSSNKVCLLQEDFDDLMRLGIDPRWRVINSGQILERGRNRVSITRMVAHAKKGDGVRLIDGDRFNLKRSNIVLYAGTGKSEPREEILLQNRHRFDHITIKPIYRNPPWMAQS